MKSKTILILTVIALLASCLSGSAQHASTAADRLNRAYQVSGVKFTVPKGFRLQQDPHDSFAIMRHEKEDLALFVAVPTNQELSDVDLMSLSKKAISKLVLNEEEFKWKISRHSEPKLSSRQSFRGVTKGLNNQRYVQTDFVVLKVQQRQIVLGSVSMSNISNEAQHFFDVEGYEYSTSGWEGLFELISAVTGESVNN